MYGDWAGLIILSSLCWVFFDFRLSEGKKVKFLWGLLKLIFVFFWKAFLSIYLLITLAIVWIIWKRKSKSHDVGDFYTYVPSHLYSFAKKICTEYRLFSKPTDPTVFAKHFPEPARRMEEEMSGEKGLKRGKRKAIKHSLLLFAIILICLAFPSIYRKIEERVVQKAVAAKAAEEARLAQLEEDRKRAKEEEAKKARQRAKRAAEKAKKAEEAKLQEGSDKAEEEATKKSEVETEKAEEPKNHEERHEEEK